MMASLLKSSVLEIQRIKVFEVTVEFDFFSGLLDSFNGRNHPFEMPDEELGPFAFRLHLKQF